MHYWSVIDLPPVVSDLDLDTLVAAVRAEDDDVDLIGCRRLEGWENVVLRTRDGWILRFPKDPEHDFIRELALLDVLASRLPVAIPRVEWTGRHTRFAAYRAVDGHHLDGDDYERAAVGDKATIAESFAETLAAIHVSLSAEEIDALGVPALDHSDALARVSGALSTFAIDTARSAETVLRQFLDRWTGPPQVAPVLLHNDFHLDNLVLSRAGGPIGGLWDFSCVALGEPTFDLRYLAGDSADLLNQVAAHYARLTEVQLDPDAAWVAIRLEDLSDAIEEGRPVDPVLNRAAR